MHNLLAIVLALFSLSLTLTLNAQEKGTAVIDKPSPRVLVITYSYTGNTKSVADLIIQKYSADTVEIKADKYEEFAGSTQANYDAWTELKEVEIEPKTIDMSNYDLIFIGSPIWWYRPSVPLWTFVMHNDFKGKDVILFNTFNSQFKQHYIDEFTTIITDNGGNFLKHIYVRRGRWYDQLSQQELLEEFTQRLESIDTK